MVELLTQTALDVTAIVALMELPMVLALARAISSGQQILPMEPVQFVM